MFKKLKDMRDLLPWYREAVRQREIADKLLAYADGRDVAIKVLVKTRMELATELNKAHELNRDLEHQLLGVEEKLRLAMIWLGDAKKQIEVGKTDYKDLRELFVASDNQVILLKAKLRKRAARKRKWVDPLTMKK